MALTLWDLVERQMKMHLVSPITKSLFGKMVHSENQEDVDKALDALEAAEGYEHLPEEE